MHDALSVYDSYPAAHALCGAHLLRELVAVSETDPDLLWPVQARQALLALNTAARAARDAGLSAIAADIANPNSSASATPSWSDWPATPAPLAADRARPATCSNVCVTAKTRS